MIEPTTLPRAATANPAPAAVHDTLRRHLLVDGLDLVLDLEASRGSWMVDARDGRPILDMFGFFASSVLGMNHPALTVDEAFLAELTRAALSKPANPDVYTAELAGFVETFARVLGDPRLPHLFFVEGGALAVENALKTAFDWKRKHNAAHGRPAHLGTKVLHLRKAFHGRSGYTLSLTNTDPTKTDLFPTFDWPRIDVPAQRFPLDDATAAEVAAAEAESLRQAAAAFAAHPHDIACFIAEPIQGEGGDNHLSASYLLAMQELCHAHDALFVLDEVQTGCGTTGSAWAYQQLGLSPDVVAFGKKVQVGGIMAGGRVDEVADNVFTVSSRINSTWGGGLVDMVRSRRQLEIVERDGLIEQAGALGKRLVDGLGAVSGVSNARGRGLFAAVDLPDASTRGAVLARMLDEHDVLALPCGERSIRFRPALTVTEDELDLAVTALHRAAS